MRLDYLETFYWVGTLKSFGDAAKRLKVAQATVSHRIHALEAELDQELLARKGRRVALTTSGLHLLRELPALLEAWRALSKRIGAAEPETGALRIGVIESIAHSRWFIPWIERLRAEREGFELELTVETTPNLIASIDRGALDVIVAAFAAGDRTRKRVLPAMPLVFVGKAGVHTARKYELAQLARHDLLTFQASSFPHSALLELLGRAKLSKARVHAISSISAMRALVTSGFGIATLPRDSLDQTAAGAGLRALPCETRLAPLPLCLSWHEDPARPHIRTLVDDLERAAKRSRDEAGDERSVTRSVRAEARRAR